LKEVLVEIITESNTNKLQQKINKSLNNKFADEEVEVSITHSISPKNTDWYVALIQTGIE